MLTGDNACNGKSQSRLPFIDLNGHARLALRRSRVLIAILEEEAALGIGVNENAAVPGIVDHDPRSVGGAKVTGIAQQTVARHEITARQDGLAHQRHLGMRYWQADKHCECAD